MIDQIECHLKYHIEVLSFTYKAIQNSQIQILTVDFDRELP